MSLVVLLDVDNTLLDNDRVKADLRDALAKALPASEAEAFWAIYEEVRAERQVVDFTEVVRRFRARHSRGLSADRVASLVNDIPYERHLYPGALSAVRRTWGLGTPVVLSDGDPVYQPRKIARAGITGAVRGNVMVVSHKERQLDEVLARFPAERYVMVDDKAPILGRMRDRLGERLRTIHVRQGHYASDPPDGPPPDMTIDRIAELVPALRTLLAYARGTTNDNGGAAMPTGAWSAKRERQYEHIKESEKKEGRSTKTAKRIAAATVNKTRAAKNETKKKTTRKKR